jgi:hypothetical protein
MDKEALNQVQKTPRQGCLLTWLLEIQGDDAWGYNRQGS